MATSILTKFGQERSATDYAVMSKESMRWLKTKIDDLRNVSSIPRNISREDMRHNKRFMLGKMYCFFYDPKGKDDLPYYDKFPMIIALEKYSDGFLGLNLHYLPYKYRVAFLTKLMNFAILDKNNDVMRMRISYDILNASKRFKEFRPCLKRYLVSHIRSKILAIEPSEFEVASFLPIHQFKGAKPKEIWEDTINEIKGR
jgi:hypothetical protein